jgi:hypothetical protein
MTERAEFTFTVKEGASGKPWIAAEPLGGDMPSLRGLLGFDLAPGTTLEQAHSLAKYMRENIRGLSLTP